MLHELTGWWFTEESHVCWPSVETPSTHITIKDGGIAISRSEDGDWMPLRRIEGIGAATVLQVVAYLQQEGLLDDSG